MFLPLLHVQLLHVPHVHVPNHPGEVEELVGSQDPAQELEEALNLGVLRVLLQHPLPRFQVLVCILAKDPIVG